MIIDIIIVLLLIIMMGIGYSKGLVSMVMTLGLIGLSFFVAIYLSKAWLFLNLPYVGMWGQAMIIFIALTFFSRLIVRSIDFENILVVGIFSRILGALLYGVIYLGILFLVAGVCILISPYTEITYLANSQIYAYIKILFEQFNQSLLGLTTFIC